MQSQSFSMGKRRTSRRRSQRRRSTRGRAMTFKAQNIVRSAEKKYYDSTIGATVPDTTGVCDDAVVNSMQQGNSAILRVGNQVSVTEVLFRGVIYPPQAAAANPNDVIRIMLVHDKQTNGAQPAFTDLITSTGSTALDFRNMGDAPRFTILWDKTFAVQYFNPSRNAEMVAGGTTRFFKGKVKVPKALQKTQYKQSTASTFVDINSGAIFWAYVTALQANGDAKYGVNIVTRCRFLDN